MMKDAEGKIFLTCTSDAKIFFFLFTNEKPSVIIFCDYGKKELQ